MNSRKTRMRASLCDKGHFGDTVRLQYIMLEVVLSQKVMGWGSVITQLTFAIIIA